MSTTTLPLVGRDHEPGMLILTTIFLILVVALGVLNAGAVALLGVLFLPVAAYFLHRAQRQRLFGKASLKVAEHDGQRWVVTLTTRRHIDLVDSLLRLSAHQVFLIRNNEGAFVEARRELYRQTTDLLEATLADAPAGEVCFLIPKPTRALPSSGVYERTGIEWRLTLIHRPAYWSTVSREWPVKVGLGPR